LSNAPQRLNLAAAPQSGARRSRVKLAIALLLASTVAVAAASGAELPSRNAPPPAAKAKTCSIGGVPGFTLPGSDVCVRIGGSVSAQVSAGSVSTQRFYTTR
jgi:hypothetical protein